MDNNFLELLESVKRRLADRQASTEVIALVEDVLVRQHQQFHEVMASEAVKRQTLLEHIKALEVSWPPSCLSEPCSCGLFGVP